MARLVVGAACSHALALMEPDTWDRFRAWNREHYARRYGALPPENPHVEQESDEDIARRYEAVRAGLDALRERLRAADLDALIIIGDDQDENFTEENLPQLAVYLGEDFHCVDRSSGEPVPRVYRCQPDLAWHLYEHSVNSGFDLAACKRFPDGQLKAHAVGPVLARLVPDARVPVVPIFVEAIHHPAVSPARCHQFGQTLRTAVELWTGGERVGVCASGGLSHFTAGYPYKALEGRHGFAHGSISEDFDRQALSWMANGEAEKLSGLSSRDLLEHGAVELRSWITLLGMVGGARAERLAYEPLYRGLMGMGVASWSLEAPVAASAGR